MVKKMCAVRVSAFSYNMSLSLYVTILFSFVKVGFSCSQLL